MDVEAVTEFLSCLRVLQSLPSSSLKKIAQLLLVKRYVVMKWTEISTEKGEYVLCEGETGHGVYFIWEGEAAGSVRAEEENRIEFQLNKYDYFGHGLFTAVQPVDVIASTRVPLLHFSFCRLLSVCWIK